MTHPYPDLKKFVDEKISKMHLHPNIMKLLEIAISVGALINGGKTPVTSCNLPTQKGEDNENLVLIVQGRTDSILKGIGSPLEKILKVADTVNEWRAGNCQHKALLGFKLLLDAMKEAQLASYQKLPSLEIRYANEEPGHFYIVIDDAVICDPWAQLYYPIGTIAEDTFAGDIRPYFKIDRNWQCHQAMCGGHELRPCQASTYHTYAIAPVQPTSFSLTSNASNPHAPTSNIYLTKPPTHQVGPC